MFRSGDWQVVGSITRRSVWGLWVTSFRVVTFRGTGNVFSFTLIAELSGRRGTEGVSVARQNVPDRRGGFALVFLAPTHVTALSKQATP